MNLPIRIRMTLWYAALMAIIVGAVGAFLVLRLRADLTGQIDRSLRPAAGQIATDYARENLREFRDSSGTVLKGERAASQLLDREGRVLTTFGDPVAMKPMIRRGELAAALGGDTVSVTRALGSDGQTFRLVARDVRRRGVRQVVVAGQSLAPAQRSVRRVVVLLLLALPAAVLATAVGGWALARRSLRPVAEMTSTAGAIGVDRLEDRVAEPRTRDEVAHLARTLNTMLDRIADGVQEHRRLVADASHELRTPLAAMRAEIDVSLLTDELSPAARDVLVSTREEVDRLSRTVDDLLTLAAVDDGALELRFERGDLAGMTEAVVDDLRPLAGRRAVTIELDAAPVPILVDPSRFAHAIRNVVENAIDFTPPGSIVRVTTTAQDGSGRLVVQDDGPGVPEELRERIFDRFFRADPSRTRATGGSGLGLAITREIVRAHGGRVGVEPRAQGAAFVIDVPRVGVPETRALTT
jgi:two-component system OmpR family sensor kinase